MEIFGSLQSLGIEWGTGVMFILLLLLLLTGMPLAYVTLMVALIFALGWFGPTVVPLITSNIFSFVSSFVFVSVPMFVLMAAVLDRSGIARDLFDAMKIVGGKLRGGVAIQTVFVAVILAAMSGIIGGEVVLLGLVALPQMLRLGYDKHLAIGVVCAGGALGTMVPPSIVLIIYGLTANVSIGDLFTSAFVPGLMLAGFYVTYILVRSYMNPDIAPIPTEEDDTSLAEKLKLLKGLILPLCVVVAVLGSIYGGVASVTEASAVGVFGVILYNRTWRVFARNAERCCASIPADCWDDRLDWDWCERAGWRVQPDGRHQLRIVSDHWDLGQSFDRAALYDVDLVHPGYVFGLGRDRPFDDAYLCASRC